MVGKRSMWSIGCLIIMFMLRSHSEIPMQAFDDDIRHLKVMICEKFRKGHPSVAFSPRGPAASPIRLGRDR